jgi:hypothetical protein
MTDSLLLTSTLAEARQWMRERIDDGVTCPCCEQKARVYLRKLNRTMVLLPLELSRRNGFEWTHVPTFARQHLISVAHQGGYLTMSQHWGLIEEERLVRTDGGRAGWWRLTRKGSVFVNGRAHVPERARIYDGRCLGLIGNPISIHDALGTPFDLRDIRPV